MGRKPITVITLFRLLHIDQPDVDVLPTARLMAMHRQDVLAGLQRLHRRLVQRAILILSRIARSRADQDAVQIDPGVFIVMNPQTEFMQRLVP